MAGIDFPFAASATRRVPTSGELANGYGCGDADLELFDWLAWYFSGQIGGVIEGAGLTTDDADLQQLLKAIRRLITVDARAPFNAQQAGFTARASLSGTGFVNYQSGSYTKKSATSSLIVSMTSNIYAASNAPGILRATFGANTVQAVISANDGTQARPAANVRKIISGIAAGVLTWQIAFGRNDAVSWNAVVNPTNTDVGFLPSETATSITFEEVEP